MQTINCEWNCREESRELSCPRRVKWTRLSPTGVSKAVWDGDTLSLQSLALPRSMISWRFGCVADGSFQRRQISHHYRSDRYPKKDFYVRESRLLGSLFWACVVSRGYGPLRSDLVLGESHMGGRCGHGASGWKCRCVRDHVSSNGTSGWYAAQAYHELGRRYLGSSGSAALVDLRGAVLPTSGVSTLTFGLWTTQGISDPTPIRMACNRQASRYGLWRSRRSTGQQGALNVPRITIRMQTTRCKYSYGKAGAGLSRPVVQERLSVFFA